MRNFFLIVATATAGVVTLATGHPWIGLAIAAGGSSAYGMLVLRDLIDPRLIRRLCALSDESHLLCQEDDHGQVDPLKFDLAIEAIEPEDHRERFHVIVTAHEAIRSQYVSSSPLLRSSLRETYRRCTEVSLQSVEARLVKLLVSDVDNDPCTADSIENLSELLCLEFGTIEIGGDDVRESS